MTPVAAQSPLRAVKIMKVCFIARCRRMLKSQEAISYRAQFEIPSLPTETAAVIRGGVATPQVAAPDEVATPPIEVTTPTETSVPWSESLQSLLEQPPAALPRHLILGGFVFAVVIGVWSWFGTVKEVSVAQGKVAPEGDVYKVQPTMNGEITHILVAAGERVEQGQIIAKIDDTLIDKEIRRLEESLANSQLQLKQTQALMQQTQSELNILQTITQADIAARQSSLRQEEATSTTHRQILEQLHDDHQAQVDRMARLKDLVEQGAFAEDHLFQLEQSLRDRDRSITETQGGIEHSEAAIAQLTAELAQTQAMSEQQVLAAQEKLQQFQIEATNLESQIKETAILLEQSKAELAQTVLTAPTRGVVSALAVNNIGEVLEAGETVAEIAPGAAPLILSTLLPSGEAGLVNVGMPVNIKFDAFPYQDYGIVTGEVLSISPDAKQDEKLGPVYELDVALGQIHVEDGGKAVPLRAGQTATVEIIVRQRRILSVVLDPIRKLQKKNISL